MKIKLLAGSVVMAGALMASGSASAGIFASGTVNQWIDPVTYGSLTLFGGATQTGSTVTDDDGDLTLTWTGVQTDFMTGLPTSVLGLSGDLSGLEDFVLVTLSESEILNLPGIQDDVDVYTVDFDFNTNLAGYTGDGGDFEYTLATIPAIPHKEIFSVSQNSTVDPSSDASNESVQLALTNPTLFYTSTSINGAPVPSSGHDTFNGKTQLTAHGTLAAAGGTIFTVSNEFDVHAVPEPMTLTLMGIGLAAFGVRRRFA